jgi:hypothetical protein
MRRTGGTSSRRTPVVDYGIPGCALEYVALHDVGVCFLSEPFPSLCPAGSTLSTSGPCVVGPGSNPH